MQRIVFLIITAFLIIGSDSVYADDTVNAKKDECLLASEECTDIVDSVKMKADKLKVEIEKGNKVYTPDELDTLKAKLKEANTILDNYLNE